MAKIKFFALLDKKIKKLRWFDISLIKLSAAAFVLMLAKLWQPLLALDWHWYAIISLLAALRPVRVFLSK